MLMDLENSHATAIAVASIVGLVILLDLERWEPVRTIVVKY